MRWGALSEALHPTTHRCPPWLQGKPPLLTPCSFQPLSLRLGQHGASQPRVGRTEGAKQPYPPHTHTSHGVPSTPLPGDLRVRGARGLVRQWERRAGGE